MLLTEKNQEVKLPVAMDIKKHNNLIFKEA